MSQISIESAHIRQLSDKKNIDFSVDLSSSNFAADSNDVHLFENSLYHDPLANKIIGQVDNISNSLAEKKLEFEKLLKKAADSSDAKDILNATRALSEYSLQTTIITKVASKSSQSLQKLTSPQ